MGELKKVKNKRGVLLGVSNRVGEFKKLPLKKFYFLQKIIKNLFLLDPPIKGG